MEIQETCIPETSPHGFQLKLFNVHPPAGRRAFREHRHIQFEIVLFKSGSGIYTTSFKQYDIQSGDVFVFSSNEIHCITDIGNQEEMTIMNVHIEPRYLWSSELDTLSHSHLDMCFRHSPQFENRLPRDNPHTNKVREMLLEMEQEFDTRQTEYVLMVRMNLMNILVTLLREFHYADPCCQNGTDISRNLRHIPSIKAAMDYIQLHLTEPLTLNGIADAVGVSPTYFSAVFKQVNGITLWEYISKKRIEAAMQIFDSKSGDNILDVALQCGFNNTANFNKMFRKYTGRTPSEYRKYGYTVFY